MAVTSGNSLKNKEKIQNITISCAIKREVYMNKIKLRKSGTFYNVYDDDCYIFYSFFHYQIKNQKIGFPKSALAKVINKLEENKIDYEIIGDRKEKKQFKKLNRYLKYVRLGKEKYNQDLKYQNIMEKLEQADDFKLEKILKQIEVLLDE